MKNKEGEKMGVFIEQVQHNNQLQQAIYTTKQKEQKEKEARAKERAREKEEKRESALIKKEAIEEMNAYLDDVFIGIIKRKKADNMRIDYATQLKNELLLNKNDIINDIFKSTCKKEIISNAWHNAVLKKYKEAKEIEIIINEKLRAQEVAEYKKEMQKQKELQELRTQEEQRKAEQRKKQLSFKWLKVKENATTFFKMLNTIANILLLPFIILFGIIGILTNAGIKESKKDINKW